MTTQPTARGNAAGRPFGRPPVLLVVAGGLGLVFLVLPVVAVVARAPWGSVGAELGTADVRRALWLSLETTASSAALCLLLGVPLGWLLARVDFRGRRLARAFVTLPLVMPPVVGGVALLLTFGRTGLLGGWLDSAFGITVPFTTAAVVLAQTFVALPFMVLSVEGAFRSTDARYDDAAATLGASRLATFWHVTLPLAAPGVVSGLVLSWARALGEFGATITFAGNFPGTTRTMPIEVYLALQSDPDAAIALSLVMIALSIAVLVALRERWISGVST